MQYMTIFPASHSKLKDLLGFSALLIAQWGITCNKTGRQAAHELAK